MTTSPTHVSVPSVRIPLSGKSGLSATMDVADYQRLLTTGIKPTFYLNANRRGGQSYVRIPLPGEGYQRAVVARLILGVGRDQVVIYRNRDRLDLRRENLTTQLGRAGKRLCIAEGRSLRAAPREDQASA